MQQPLYYMSVARGPEHTYWSDHEFEVSQDLQPPSLSPSPSPWLWQDSMYHSAQRRKEGAEINASLYALKAVITTCQYPLIICCTLDRAAPCVDRVPHP